MKFSIYSELQYWGGKTPGRLYEEVIEQVVHADRLGYDCYAIIEHPFFPKFSISTNPFAFYAKCMERTKQIRFRTLGHILPMHNPLMLASQIAAADILFDGRYELGLVRGHGWHPPKAGIPIEETREIYDESLELVLRALSEERFSHTGTYFQVDDTHVVPRPISERFRIFLGGTSDKTYELAGRHGWGVTVPPLLPYEAMRRQLDIYRETCAANGHEPYIVWIHACYLDEDRATAIREAERGMRQFLEGNASPLTGGDRLPPKDVLERSGYGFYASGILEQLAQTPYEEMLKGDIVWVGTPEDVIERIEQVVELCEGLAEISITVNPGGFAHWQAIKAQELFADRVMPHFGRGAAVEAGALARA
jgi:alkanesulfonate monooxygenase SsuD/methylene tetrahydromethanopterin reductase-like flavin-dependent oxidoreductase (luciferase family)